MLAALGAMLANILEPLIEKLAASLFAKMAEMQRQERDRTISENNKQMNQAGTSDEIRKAAAESAHTLGGL